MKKSLYLLCVCVILLGACKKQAEKNRVEFLGLPLCSSTCADFRTKLLANNFKENIAGYYCGDLDAFPVEIEIVPNVSTNTVSEINIKCDGTFLDPVPAELFEEFDSLDDIEETEDIFLTPPNEEPVVAAPDMYAFEETNCCKSVNSLVDSFRSKYPEYNFSTDTLKLYRNNSDDKYIATIFYRYSFEMPDGSTEYIDIDYDVENKNCKVSIQTKVPVIGKISMKNI